MRNMKKNETNKNLIRVMKRWRLVIAKENAIGNNRVEY